MESAIKRARRGTCVVSFDVAGSFRSFSSRGLQVPERNDPIFNRLRRSLLKMIGKALPDVEIVAIDKDALRSELWKSVKDRADGHSVLVTCSEMAALDPSPEGLNLSINRLFDANGKMLGYGPRPGYKYLSDQFDDLARKISGRSVILAKEGAFKGNTCRFIVEELEKRGINVAILIMGFCDLNAKAFIEEKFGGEFVIIRLFDHLVEWIADRDLIPFMPGCGRVRGEISTHSYTPIRTAEGFSCAFPYILPFGMTERWMSISEKHASELSAHFLELGIELFRRIEQESGSAITAGDILSDNPRVSMPARVAQNGQIPGQDTRIVEFLKEMRKGLEK